MFSKAPLAGQIWQAARMITSRLPRAAQDAAVAYVSVILLWGLLALCSVLDIWITGGFGQLLQCAASTALVTVVVAVFLRHRPERLPREPETVNGWRWQQFVATFVPAIAVYGCAMLLDRKVPIWYLLRVPAATDVTSGHGIFLDLAHLVDAANCNASVSPGQVVCDRLDRTFNQNPLWVEAMRPLLRQVDLQLLGLLLGLCFITGAALLATTRRSAHVLAIPMLFSPSVALAIERGQPDLFVWLLAIPGVLLLSRSRTWFNVIGVALLVAATILKVFPVLLLLPFLVLPGRQRRLVSAAGVGVTFFYWLALRDLLSTMLASTQRGRLLSYGLETMLPKAGQQLFAAAIVIALVAGGALLARQIPTGRRISDQAIVAAFACFYLGSFLAGANWSYRLVFALMLVGRLRPPTTRGDLLRTDSLLVLTAVPLLWLTPVPAGAVWQLLVAVVSTAVLLIVAVGLLRKPIEIRNLFVRPARPSPDGESGGPLAGDVLRVQRQGRRTESDS
jgi:hypothetical protein